MSKESVATISIHNGATARDIVKMIEGIEATYYLNYDLQNGEIEVLKNEC